MSRVRVLVVDHSVVACKIVADALGGDPQIEVVGTAADGRIALTMVEELAPDLITMDLEMPLLDGVETVRALRRRGDRRPIIVFTAASAQDAKATLNALTAGATDFVTKPSNMISSDVSLEQVAEELIPRIKALVPHPGAGSATSLISGAAAPVGQGADAVRLAVPPKGPRRPVRLVVMGASMGAPMPCPAFFGRSPDCLSRLCWCSTCPQYSRGSSRPCWTLSVRVLSWSRLGARSCSPDMCTWHRAAITSSCARRRGASTRFSIRGHRPTSLGRRSMCSSTPRRESAAGICSQSC